MTGSDWEDGNELLQLCKFAVRHIKNQIYSPFVHKRDMFFTINDYQNDQLFIFHIFPIFPIELSTIVGDFVRLVDESLRFSSGNRLELIDLAGRLNSMKVFRQGGTLHVNRLHIVNFSFENQRFLQCFTRA